MPSLPRCTLGSSETSSVHNWLPQVCSKSASALVTHDLVRTVTSCVWRSTARRDYLSHFAWFQLLFFAFALASVFGTAPAAGREGSGAGGQPWVEAMARLVLVRCRHVFDCIRHSTWNWRPSSRILRGDPNV